MSSADEAVAAEPSVEDTTDVEATVDPEAEPRDAEATDRPEGHVLPPQPFKYAYFATIGVGVALLTLGAFSSLATVLVYVGVAFFLAVALDPLIGRAVARGMSRGLAVGLTSLASVVLIVGVILLVIPALNEQIGIVARNAIAFAQSVPDQPWFQWVNENLGGVINLDNMTQTVLGYISDPNQLVGLAGGIFAVGSGIIDGITGVTIVTILTIYFTASLPSVKHAGYRLVARSRRTRFVQISEEIFQSTGKYVSRQIMLAGVNAAFTFVLSWVAGSPAPALLAAIAFVGALIPVVGTVIAAIIAVLLTLLVNPVGALVIGIVMLIYMQFEAYVLSPRVMSKAVSVPGSVVIVAAVAGAALAGILGALVAVPVAAAIMIILERVVYPQQERA